ncbi:4-hydroxyphenylpyruvate dioxygenase [Elysia marginata]|uniref:4-hydroxyphenylpyruvate dioxygenase n=1 Tax=Elysia marginata TaxID=1093978 RepID=A0AAV4I1W8_9GAST|nr:4-hydroxyphenylpyruvate dioxygenase [Elysia marginata]
MAGFACVHHIEIGAVDGAGTVDVLRDRFTFTLQATRFTPLADQWLLAKNNTRFLITSLKCSDKEKLQKDPYVINWASYVESGDKLPTRDSAFNIAFQVKDLDTSLRRLNNNGAVLSKPVQTEHDANGSVRAVTVKSCVGDMHHTLIEKGEYSGCFLPGFTELEPEDSPKPPASDIQYPLNSVMEAFDHVALCVEMNTSMEIIGWYERCFGMKRFLINADEEDDQGLILSTNDVGLRLRAMEYWKCAEVGLVTEEESAGSECTVSRLSMVIGEGLPPLPGSTEENQVVAWMRHHGGPGIQHVAISTSDIKGTVTNLKQAGVEFAVPPPPAYYTEVGRLNDIIQAGEDVDLLRRHGILIDTEADGIHYVSEGDKKEEAQRKDSYLLQIFTKPMLTTDPFFMEFIQREGASGFGSGNVAALYRSVQDYIVNK